MAVTVVLGSKGEIILPRKIRSDLGIEAGDELELSVENDRIVLRKKAGRFAAYLERLSRHKEEKPG
jgi:AbrB family looped-hinge helix DNA binding protein